MNYTVGDIAIRIKNGVRARRKKISFVHAQLTKNLLALLVKEGFLHNVKTEEKDGKKTLVAEIVAEDRLPIFTDVRIISKPSLRVYADKNMVEKMQKRSVGQIIVSTSQGLVTGKEAIKKGLGGEVLFEIW